MFEAKMSPDAESLMPLDRWQETPAFFSHL
jgi:hypothetical protein